MTTERKPASGRTWLQELRRRGREELEYDVLPAQPGLNPRVSPVIVDWNLNDKTVVWSGGIALATIDHKRIERESPEHLRLIRVLLETLSNQASVAINAVVNTNLKLGKANPWKSVATRQRKQAARDAKLWKLAIGMLAKNRRLGYDGLARLILEKHPKAGRSQNAVRRRLAYLLGR
jgi:hypothetical protein